MLNVQVRITGDKKTIDQLRRFKSEVNDWSGELENVGDYLMSFYQNDVFETEGAAFGIRWKPLSQRYEAKKRTKYPGRGILEASGRMRRAWAKQVTKTKLIVANISDYSEFHQLGTSKMPQRPLVNIDDRLKDKIVDIFKEGLISKIKSSF